MSKKNIYYLSNIFFIIFAFLLQKNFIYKKPLSNSVRVVFFIAITIVLVLYYIINKKFIKYKPAEHERATGIYIIVICYIINLALILFVPDFYSKIVKQFDLTFFFLCLAFIITETVLMLKKEK